MPVTTAVRRALTAAAVAGLLLGAAAVPQAVAAAPGGEQAAEQPQYVTKPCPGGQHYYPADVPEKFWECSNGIAYLFDCPAGLHWDTELLTCNYPEAAGWEPPTSRTGSGRRSGSSGSDGMQRLETKHIQGQVITHTIVKPLSY